MMSQAWVEVLYECLHLLGAALAALLVRYLLGIATPQEDWRKVETFARDVASLVKIPDAFAGFNMERLTRLRDDIASGMYASDHIIVMPFIVIDGNEATHDETSNADTPTVNHYDSGNTVSTDRLHTDNFGYQPG